MPKEWADERDVSGGCFPRDSHFRYRVDGSGLHIRLFEDGKDDAWLSFSPEMLEWMLKKVNEDRHSD